jgi:hypothetical protein
LCFGLAQTDPRTYDTGQHSRYGGPKAAYNEKTGGSADELWHDEPEMSLRTQGSDSTIDESAPRQEA